MSFSKILTAILASTALVAAAWAEPVTLKSTTSSVELVGELISFDNEVYIIATDLGELEVDARTVVCSGISCPEIKPTASKFSIFGNRVQIYRLLVPLLENYSQSLGATIDTTPQSGDKSLMKITAKDGQEFAMVSIQSGHLAKLKTEISAAQNALVIKSSLADMMVAPKTGANSVLLAADALVAITSDTNAIKSISIAALQNVLSGAITNWKALGGPDADINLYLPETTADLVEMAKGLGFDLAKSATAVRFGDFKELSKVAASDPYGLGFTNFANKRAANALALIGKCGAYIQPDRFNIASGNYPATYYHYLQITSETPPIFAREFLSFLKESQAMEIIDRQGYSSLSVFETGLENQGNRVVHGLLATEKSIPIEDFRTTMRSLNGARQLSTVLRFSPNTRDLSPQSLAALDTLISDLFLGRFADQTLMVVGFTGSKGSNDANKTKSKASAQTILDYIKGADDSGLLTDLQIEVLGFGEASPLACEDTPQGKAINNRIEIWVKDAF